MKEQQLHELLLQSLEHEKGGVEVYAKALDCVINEDLREEWQRYFEETQNHVRVLTQVCEAVGLDPNQESPGRTIVRKLGGSLVAAMSEALANAPREAAQLVACECVVIAETKDHLDWELIGKCAENAKGAVARTLKDAYDEIEDQEDEHLYHTKGWCRELWIESLGMKALLPPPEETKDAKTAIEAARAEMEGDRQR